MKTLRSEDPIVRELVDRCMESPYWPELVLGVRRLKNIDLFVKEELPDETRGMQLTVACELLGEVAAARGR